MNERLSGRMTLKCFVLAAASTAVMVTAMGHPAFAEQAVVAADPGGQKEESSSLNEIIVTATKRAETLQTVPVSIQALTGEGLEERSLRNIQDFARFVPGMVVTPTGANGFNNIVIRGISSTGGGQPPTVITYLDDLLIPNTFDAQIYDIARIEVLKGPQGDLYGASSAGGLLHYVSAAPDFTHVYGRVEASGSSTSDGRPNWGGAGFVNLPLSETVALRTSAVFDHFGGFIDNFDPATGMTAKDADGQDRFTGRMSLAVKPSEAFDVVINGLFNTRYVGAFSNVDDAPFLQENTPEDRRSVRFKNEFLKTNGSVINGTINGHTSFGTFTSSSGYFRQEEDIDFDTTGLNFYDPALFGGFSIPGFDPRVDGPFATNPRNAIISVTHRRQKESEYTQELRFASDWHFPVQLLAGAFYLHDRLEDNYLLTFSQPIPDFANYFGGPADALKLVDYNDVTKFEEKAGFGNLSWKFLDDRADLKFGARHYERSSDRLVVDGAGPILFPYGQRGANTVSGNLFSFSGSYELTRSLFAYARYSEGFRPGQQRALPPSICDAALLELGFNRATLSAFTDPESLKNIEGGLRFSDPDHRFSANVTGFRIKYDSIQQSIRLPSCSSSIVANGGSATSRGAELELGVSPIAGLTFNADMGYTKSTFDTSNPALGINAGEPLQFVPEWTAALRGDYRFPIAADMAGIVRGDVTFTDARTTDFGTSTTGPTPAGTMPSFTLVGLQAGVDIRKWEILGVVTNLFDKTPVYNNDVVLYGGVGGRTYSVGRPRTIGVRVTRDF